MSVSLIGKSFIGFKTKNTSKTKKESKALSNISFEVKQGEVFGLLGPNGAGKTTFLSILGGTVTKTSGSVNVWGFNLDKNPRHSSKNALSTLTGSRPWARADFVLHQLLLEEALRDRRGAVEVRHGRDLDESLGARGRCLVV